MTNQCLAYLRHSIVLSILLVVSAVGCGPSEPEESESYLPKDFGKTKFVREKNESSKGEPYSGVRNSARDNYDFLIENFRPTQSTFPRPDSQSDQFTKTDWLQKDVNEMEMELYLEGISQFEKSYQGDDKEQVIDFVKKVARVVTVDADKNGRQIIPDMIARVEQIMPQDIATADPMLNLFIAMVYSWVDGPKAFMFADAAVKRFSESDYPARFAVNAHILRTSTYPKKVGRRRTHVNQQTEAVLYWLTQDLRLTPDQYRVAIWPIKTMFLEHKGKSNGQLRDIVDVIQNEKRIPEYLKQIALGYAHNRMAWNSRGGGYANSVTQGGATEFERSQRKALVHLKNAHRINPNFPHAAHLMMDIARTGNVNEPIREWFQASIAAQFDYLPAYDSMLFYLYPRWHGSPEQMIEFGRMCLKSERYDTSVPYFFISAINQAVSQSSRNPFTAARQIYVDDPKLYGDVKRCLMSYMNRPDMPVEGGFSKKRLLSKLAGFAVNALKYDEAKSYFDQIGNDIDRISFNEALVPLTPKNARAMVEVMTGGGDSVKRAGQAAIVISRLSGGDLLETNALQEIVKLGLENATNEHQRIYWQSMLRVGERFEKFNNGKWVDNWFCDEMAAWHSMQYSYVEFESDNSMLIDTRGDEIIFEFAPWVGLSGPKQIEFEIEFIDAREDEDLQNTENLFAPGIRIQGSGSPYFFLSFIVHNSVLAFSAQNQPTGEAFYKKPENRNTKVQINCDQKFVEVFCNGKLALRTRLSNVGGADNIYLSTTPNQKAKGKIRYRNFRIKHWELGPPPIPKYDNDLDLDQLLDYYTEAVNLEPDNGRLWEYLGMVYHGKSEFQSAQEAFEQALAKGRTKRFIGFYLGDMAERNGDLSAAKKHYYDAAICGNQYEINANVIKSDWSNPQRLAVLRYKWLHYLDPANSNKTRDDFKEDFKGFGRSSSEPKWANTRIRAADLAVQGNYDGAIRALTRIEKMPANLRSEIAEQIAAYEKKQIYRPDSGKPMFYRQIDYSSFHMRFWDQIIPESRQYEHSATPEPKQHSKDNN